MQTILKKLECLLFPYLCVLCWRASDRERDLCSECDENLPRLTTFCQQCADRIHTCPEQAFICGKCLKDSPFYDYTVPLFEYTEPIDTLIHRLKFGKKLLYARLLGELMANALSERYQDVLLPECIVPVPLHSKRLRDRGFNQSLELGRAISHRLKIPMEPFLCKRVKNTVQQSSIPIDQRKQNVEQSFVYQGRRFYERVAILDDVVTTGFTVNALSQALKANGVIEVTVWCCARVCR